MSERQLGSLGCRRGLGKVGPGRSAWWLNMDLGHPDLGGCSAYLLVSEHQEDGFSSWQMGCQLEFKGDAI